MMFTIVAIIFTSGFLTGASMVQVHSTDQSSVISGPESICEKHGGILAPPTYDGGSLVCADLTSFTMLGEMYGNTPAEYEFERAGANRSEVIFNLSLASFPEVERTYIDVPADFKRFKRLYSFSLEDECDGAVAKEIHEDGLVFIFTSDGDCDGDNSYGLVYQHSKIIGLIIDSQFEKITPEEMRGLK